MITRVPNGIRTLGLPLRSPRRAFGAAGLLLLAYAITMARDLSLFDSAELSLVAVQLGLGHPVGQPVHTLLGFVFAHLPGVPPLFGLNLLSALCGALCVVPAISLAEQVLDRGSDLGTPDPAWPMIAISLALGMHVALWEPATRVEVYTLAAFFALWAIARVAAAEDPARAVSDFVCAGVALGLGAAVNPYVSIIAALAVAPGVLYSLATRRLSLRVVPAAVGGGVLGLVPYVYVPLVARRTGVTVWGAPSDLTSLRAYLLGLDYARSRGITAHEWIEHVWQWLFWALDRGVLPVIVLGLLGMFAVGRRFDIALAAVISTALTILLIASNTVWQPDVPDYLSYAIAPLWLAGAGMIGLTMRMRRGASAAVTALLVLAFCGLCAAAPPPVWTRTRHRDHVARMLAAGALSEAPPRAFVLVESDHWAAPILYLQQAEHVRPDVVVIALGLTSSSWFWRQTFERHADLHVIPLAGPGGRNGRVLRLLAANPERPVMIENFDAARTLGLPACVQGWLRSVRAQCAVATSGTVEQSVRRQVASIGDGSPSALAALSDVALRRGLDLWKQGAPLAAEDALLSAVPLRNSPKLLPLSPVDASRIGPPPAIEWTHDVALGEPARNLFAASLLRARAGDGQAALALARAAAALGLPEAEHLIVR